MHLKHENQQQRTKTVKLKRRALIATSKYYNPTSVRCLITVRQLHALPLPMYNVYGRGYKHTS